MRPRMLRFFSIGFLLIFIYDLLTYYLSGFIDLPPVPGDRYAILTLCILLSSVSHAVYTLGWRHALFFITTGFLISWGYEQYGVISGSIFGNYYYTDRLGLKLGHVPFLIPMAWFMMIYPSYIIANLIDNGRILSPYQGGIRKVLWLSVLSAGVMTAWDLVIDPKMAGPSIQAWVWKDGGAYFGVPAMNFFGWMLTTFTVYAIYRTIEYRRPPRPMGSFNWFHCLLPVLMYLSAMFSAMKSSQLPESARAVQVLAPFVMGLPVVAALMRMGDKNT